MPDYIIKDEPTATLREITLSIADLAGNPKTGITHLTATIKIAKAGGNLVASSATLTEVTGGASGGGYRLQLPQGEVDTVGDLQFEITQSGDIQPVYGYVPIRPTESLDVFSQTGEGSYTYGDLLRIAARALAAPFTKVGSDYVVRDLDDSKDSHEMTVTPSGKSGVNIIDPT